MSSKKSGILELFYAKIAPIITGVGASIVIIGALFKLQHWPGASVMLTVGLSTEALLFLLFAFQPQAHEPDWSKVYPELAEDFEDFSDAPVKDSKGNVKKAAPSKVSGDAVSQKLDQLMDGKIGPELIDSLGKGMTNLSESVKKLSTLGDAAEVTNEYASNVKAASNSISEMNKAYASTLAAVKESVGSTQSVIKEITESSRNVMTEVSNTAKSAMGEITNASKETSSAMIEASKDAKEYHSQLQGISKNLGALNAVYEMELKDSNNHLQSMNKFYSNLTVAMDNMSNAARDTEEFKNEINKLTSNLTSLNKVYGSMLTAMKG